MQALDMAMVGNTRGLKQYGIVLDENALKAAAFKAGLDPDKLTKAQEATLRLQTITAALAGTHGHAAAAAQGSVEKTHVAGCWKFQRCSSAKRSNRSPSSRRMSLSNRRKMSA